MAPTPVCAVGKRDGAVAALLSDMHCVVPPVAGRPPLYLKSARSVGLAGVARKIIKQQKSASVGFSLESVGADTAARHAVTYPAVTSVPQCDDSSSQPANVDLPDGSVTDDHSVPLKHVSNGSLLTLSKPHSRVDDDMDDDLRDTNESPMKTDPSPIARSCSDTVDATKPLVHQTELSNGCRPFYEHEVAVGSCPVSLHSESGGCTDISSRNIGFHAGLQGAGLVGSVNSADEVGAISYRDKITGIYSHETACNDSSQPSRASHVVSHPGGSGDVLRSGGYGDVLPRSGRSGDVLLRSGGGGDVLLHSGGSGDVLLRSGGYGDVLPHSGGSGDVLLRSGGGGDVLPHSGGSGDVLPRSEGDGDALPHSEESGDVLRRCGGGGDVILHSVGADDVLPRCGGGGDVIPHSVGAGDVLPHSGDGGDVLLHSGCENGVQPPNRDVSHHSESRIASVAPGSVCSAPVDSSDVFTVCPSPHSVPGGDTTTSSTISAVTCSEIAGDAVRFGVSECTAKGASTSSVCSSAVTAVATDDTITCGVRPLTTQCVLEQRCGRLLRRLYQLQTRLLHSQFRAVCTSLELPPADSRPPTAVSVDCLTTAGHQLRGLSRQLDEQLTESSCSDSDGEDDRARLSANSFTRQRMERSVLTSRWMRNACHVSSLDDRIHQLCSLQRRVFRRRRWLTDESLQSCSRTTALRPSAAVMADRRHRRRLLSLSRMSERPAQRCWQCRVPDSTCVACRGTSDTACGIGDQPSAASSCSSRLLADAEWRRRYLYPPVSALSANQRLVSGTRPAVSADLGDKDNPGWRAELSSPCAEVEGGPSTTLHRSSRVLRRHVSYDVDMVLPPGVAATGKIERLKYKDITTPGWRDVSPSSTRDVRTAVMEEDTSDAEFSRRHAASEAQEHGRLFKTAADAPEYAITVQTPSRVFPSRHFPLCDAECRLLFKSNVGRSSRKRASVQNSDDSPPAKMAGVETSSLSPASSSTRSRSPLPGDDVRNRT